MADKTKPNVPTAELPPEAIEFAGKMYNAARAGEIDILKQALEAGLPANMTNEKGDSLVMLASYYGHAPLVKLLIDFGGNANSVNDRGQSILAGAVFKNEPEVIEVLLEGGADPYYGNPSAMQTVVLFKQEEKWKGKFEHAPGRGKGAST